MQPDRTTANECMVGILKSIGIVRKEMSEEELDKAAAIGYGIQHSDPELAGLFLGALMGACQLFMENHMLGILDNGN